MQDGSRDVGVPQVFVIDDDDEVAQGLVMLLEVNGFGADSFSTAEDFLADHRGVKGWDCGLIDVNMPGMGGLALLDRLAEIGVPPPELLLMTGKPTAEVERRVAAAGVHQVLPKPLDPIQVVTIVQDLLAT